MRLGFAELMAIPTASVKVAVLCDLPCAAHNGSLLERDLRKVDLDFKAHLISRHASMVRKLDTQDATILEFVMDLPPDSQIEQVAEHVAELTPKTLTEKFTEEVRLHQPEAESSRFHIKVLSSPTATIITGAPTPAPTETPILAAPAGSIEAALNASSENNSFEKYIEGYNFSKSCAARNRGPIVFAAALMMSKAIMMDML